MIPKIVLPSSFDFGDDAPLFSIVDDPEVLRRKTASANPYALEWQDVRPAKNASLVHLIALGEEERTGCNRNGDSFTRSFCGKSHSDFTKHAKLYRHHKRRPNDPDGSVVRSAHNPDMGRVELLVEADHDKCADWLGDMEAGRPVAFSMGFDCHKETCSICDHPSSRPKERCEHTRKNASLDGYGLGRIMPDGRKIFLRNPEGVWNDISFVTTPADMIAYGFGKMASLDSVALPPMSGDELATLFGRVDHDSVMNRRALFAKLAQAEQVICRSMERGAFRRSARDAAISEKVASALRESGDALFPGLARGGVMLPFGDFCRVVMGEKVAQLELEDAIELGQDMSLGWFARNINNSDLIDRACSCPSYSCDKQASLPRNLLDSAAISVIERTLLPGKWQEGGENKKQAHSPETLAHAEYLLTEYAAYRLAALEHSNNSAEDISGAILLNK